MPFNCNKEHQLQKAEAPHHQGTGVLFAREQQPPSRRQESSGAWVCSGVGLLMYFLQHCTLQNQEYNKDLSCGFLDKAQIILPCETYMHHTVSLTSSTHWRGRKESACLEGERWGRAKRSMSWILIIQLFSLQEKLAVAARALSLKTG